MKSFYEHHGFDEWEAADMAAETGNYGPRCLPTCRRCGSADVRWRLQGGGWRLFSLQPGVVHTCDPVNEFDILTPKD